MGQPRNTLAKSVSAYLEPEHMALMDEVHRAFGINKGEQVKAVFDYFITHNWKLHICLVNQMKTAVREINDEYEDIRNIILTNVGTEAEPHQTFKPLREE
tara:strand:+ start:3959 stop:4258 length:300 start_codon:yes stop_codon:yes gene_type:complete